MNTEENNQEVEVAEETTEEETEEETDVITIPKSEWNKTQQTLGSLKREIKTYKKSTETSKETPNTGELAESQLEFLELKGVTDQDEIDIIAKFVAKTGQPVRQALRDDYVQSKLAALKADKAVKNATPGATKRGGNQQTDVAAAIARFEQTGELPEDYETRTEVINSVSNKGGSSRPPWRR